MSASVVTCNFSYPSGSTIAAKLFEVDNIDAGEVKTAAEVVEYLDGQGRPTGRYYATFQEVAANDYQMIIYASNVGVKSDMFYTITDDSTHVYPWSEWKPLTASDVASAAGLGTGATARDIVVTVEGEDEEGVAGARLHVLTDGEVATNLAPTTGVGGAATLRLNDGDYILRVVSPSGFATVADIEFTVDSSETPIAVTLDSTTVTPTPEAGLCTVYTTVLDPSGEFMEGATMRARLVDPNSGPNGAVVTNESIEAESDEEGYVSLDLIRADQFADGTGEYQITVSYAGEILRNITVTIPNQDSVNLEDLATS